MYAMCSKAEPNRAVASSGRPTDRLPYTRTCHTLDSSMKIGEKKMITFSKMRFDSSIDSLYSNSMVLSMSLFFVVSMRHMNANDVAKVKCVKFHSCFFFLCLVLCNKSYQKTGINKNSFSLALTRLSIRTHLAQVFVSSAHCDATNQRTHIDLFVPLKLPLVRATRTRFINSV